MITWAQNNVTKLLLTATLLLGLLLRTYQLSDNPPGFFADEASIGYNAYTILHSGTDEYGTAYPFFFRAFGEYKNPIQTYSTVPFVALFGLNEFAVRLPSVLYGLLGIIAIFLLAKQLFHRYKYTVPIALLAAFFLTISPWHIHFSRTSLEGLAAYVAFTTLGTYFFLRAQAQAKYLLASIFFFVLAFYSYFPARLFIPLFTGGLFLFHYRFFLRHRKQAFIGILLILVSSIPIFSALTASEAIARWQQVNVFSNPPENQSPLNHVAVNYLSHFSPQFLFTSGDIGMPGQFITRHSVKGIGELYLFQIPLLLAGFYLLVKRREWSIFYLLLLWLMLYPTGSMFTTDTSAQATRSIIGVVPFQIVSAFGLAGIFHLKHRYHHHHKIGTAAIGLAILFSVGYYANLLFVEYPKYASDFWGWQYGAREAVREFEKNQTKYEELVMAPEFNAPHIFFNFYAPEGCSNCIVGLPHERFDPRKKQLFAVPPEYLNKHSFKLDTTKEVIYPNGSVAFKIGEVVE